MNQQNQLGLVHVYTGNGKGKTTAALGLALRASGQGFRVGVVQFLKSDHDCGEHFFVQRYPGFRIIQPATVNPFTGGREAIVNDVENSWTTATTALDSGEYDLLVLDEALTAVYLGYLDNQRLLDLIARRPLRLELVLTGRGATPEVMAAADLVTEMVCHKHPYEKGITSRRGVEY